MQTRDLLQIPQPQVGLVSTGKPSAKALEKKLKSGQQLDQDEILILLDHIEERMDRIIKRCDIILKK